jgi:hypothetical protein
LVGGLAASRSEIADKVYEQRLLLDELTAPVPPTAPAEKKAASEHALAFWASVSQDKGVRERLQQERLPFALYKLLRGSGEEGSTTGLATSAVTGLVDLVKSLVAGHDALEEELAGMLIDDLDRLSEKRDMDFVNKVFVPLIKVERTLPITLGAARGVAEQGQPAILSGLSSLDDSAGVHDSEPSSFLATELLQKEQKGHLKSAFKQMVGEKTSEKLFSTSWSKVHEWNASAGEPPEHLAGLGLWKQLEGKGPCLVITSGKSPSGEAAVFGAFWQGKVPAIPEQLPEPARDVEAKEGDFCFCYTSGSHRHYKSADDLPLA